MMFSKHTQKKQYFLVSIFVLTFLLLSTYYFLPTRVFAATLSIDPETLSVGPGDNFVVTIRLETSPDECVNAASVLLLYPSDWINASAVSKGESLLTLWLDEPLVDREQGQVSFSGGIPAGYCGRIQGDPGKTNILAKIIFSVPGNMIGGKIATGDIPLLLAFSSSTKVLLNDGFGTPASLLLKNAEFVRTMTSQGMKNEWLDLVHKDDISPDLFTITVERDDHAFDGKNFIVFSAVDKQSGVHHYEVSEDDPTNLGFITGKKIKSSFAIATSPYVLVDQTLQSRIIVRAYDHAGNMQEAILAPKNATAPLDSTVGRSGMSFITQFSITQVLLGILGLAVLALLGWLFAVRRKKTNPL